MERILRRILLALLWPVVLLALVTLVLNTDPGRRLVVWAVIEVSGGTVVPSGLNGDLPFGPSLERLEIHDGQGPWLRIEQVAAALDHRRLLRGELAVSSATARSMTVLRRTERNQDGSGAIRLPLPVVVHHIEIDALALDPWPGAPVLRVAGNAMVAGDENSRLSLVVTAPGRADRYLLEAELADGRARLGLALYEVPGGLGAVLARAAGATLPPELGAWTLDAAAEGPPRALTLGGQLAAGPLRARIGGTVDLVARASAGLQLTADLPAMSVALSGLPAIAWSDIHVAAGLSGPLKAPRGSVRVHADGVHAGELSVEHIRAIGAGDGTRVQLAGELTGLASPLTLSESRVAAPLQIWGEVEPEGAGLPFRLAAQHQLVQVAAAGTLANRAAHASMGLPDLGAIGALVGARLFGSAGIDLRIAAADSPRIDALGELRLTHAPGPIRRLLGPLARTGLSVRLVGDDWRIESARIDGRHLTVGIQGRVASHRLDLGWDLALPDLTPLAAGWSGMAGARGAISGSPTDPRLVADLNAGAVLPGQTLARITGEVAARPAEQAGSVQLSGDWAGQPIAVQLSAGRSENDDLALSLGDSRWASLSLSGGLRLSPGAVLPRGEIRANTPRLEELAPLLSPLLSLDRDADPGQPLLAGSLDARLVLDGTGVLRVNAGGQGIRLPGGIEIRNLGLDAQVDEPLGVAQLDARLRLDGIAFDQIAGNLTVTARGPARSLALNAETAFVTPPGPVHMTATGDLNAPARRLTLRLFEGQAAGERMHLILPAVLDLADGLAVDRLRLGLGDGAIEAAGRLTPRLDLNATLTRLPVDLVRLVTPDLALAGTLDARLRLSGSLEAPHGSIRAEASGLRLIEGLGRSLPPARVELAATLGDRGSDIDLQGEVPSRADLRLRGRIDGTPLAPDTLALRTDGRVDLALLDPLLTAGGRQLRGQIRLDARITGTRAVPRVFGDLRLTDGTLWDRRIGLTLTDVQGQLRLAGDTLRVERLHARSGGGDLVLDGTIGMLAPGIPVDLRLVARDARPVQLDLLDAEGNADLRLHGRAAEALNATGSVQVRRVDIRLPDRLPPDVAVLEVRERGRATHPRPRARSDPPLISGQGIRLDLAVSAPHAIQIRGRGIDAELGGDIRLTGALAKPEATGGFALLQGQYELAGQTLRFSRGRLGFDGAAGLDPTLDLEARVTAAGSTAILQVLGTARTPRIELRGEPELPEDEVLSRLLFGVAGGRLSALQAARLGIAAATLAGLETGGGPGFLDQARTGLRLDRLSLDSNERDDATLEGGRYVSERVYLGARQGTRSGETQGVARIELTPRLRLEADVGAGGGTRGGGAFELEY